EVVVATIIQEKHRGNHDRHQRWARFERADLFKQYSDLSTQGFSQRQAAKVLDVPRSTLQAWRLAHESLDACPTVAAFFHSVPSRSYEPLLHTVLMFLMYAVLGLRRSRIAALNTELLASCHLGLGDF